MNSKFVNFKILFIFNNFFFFNDTATTEIYTLSLHDALPILPNANRDQLTVTLPGSANKVPRSEEHTSELQSRFDLVCRLLLEKKNKYLCNSLCLKKKKNNERKITICQSK